METIREVIKTRHSVRQFTDREIEKEKIISLQTLIDECNQESGLHIQLIINEKNAFKGFMAHYGKFSDCRNYIAIVAKKGYEEACGYFGEKIVLKAQSLSLNSCWVGISYRKGKVPVHFQEGEKLILVIALGYGKTMGIMHHSKPLERLCKVDRDMPMWFKNGMEAAMLAPTAMNKQQFLITLTKNKVNAISLKGFYSKVDLGIIKYHFEIGANNSSWEWE